jgi:hypothetical protein
MNTLKIPDLTYPQTERVLEALRREEGLRIEYDISIPEHQVAHILAQGIAAERKIPSIKGVKVQVKGTQHTGHTITLSGEKVTGQNIMQYSFNRAHVYVEGLARDVGITEKEGLPLLLDVARVNGQKLYKFTPINVLPSFGMAPFFPGASKESFLEQADKYQKRICDVVYTALNGESMQKTILETRRRRMTFL